MTGIAEYDSISIFKTLKYLGIRWVCGLLLAVALAVAIKFGGK